MTGGATLSGVAVVAAAARAGHHVWRPTGAGAEAIAGDGRGRRRQAGAGRGGGDRKQPQRRGSDGRRAISF
jgi:hypothetical protein